MLYFKAEEKCEYGGENSMRHTVKPQMPDTPDIDDLIFEGEHPEESEK
ncbi:hypothetical protein [Intestinibacillus massiliensis]|nr:hypothetical protein [Intestinibacillus massiliensis]